MGRLASVASDKLGPALQCDAEVSSIEPVDEGYCVHGGGSSWTAPELVLAVPPPTAARLLEPWLAEASDLLQQIPLAPIAVVHLGGLGAAPCPEGFGALVPRGEGMRSLGVLFPSNLFSDRAPDGGWLLSVFIGGTLDPEALGCSDEELLALARQDAAQLLSTPIETAWEYVVRHPRGIPQFVRGHGARIGALFGALRAHPRLRLAGNYLHGVSLDAAVRSGLDAAADLAVTALPPAEMS